MKRITIILAHQKFENSIANRTIIDALMETFPKANLRNIYSLYPDFKIDVNAEQEILLNSDIILFQFPIEWYNMPAILKQWFDEVFSYNFAYGSEGDKLKDKIFLASITVGGPNDSYSPLGYNHFRVEDFFKNIEQTAYLAQMKYISPVFGFGYTYIPGVYNTLELVQQRASEQAYHLIGIVKKLLTDAD